MKSALGLILAFSLSFLLLAQDKAPQISPNLLPRYDVTVEMVGLFATVLDRSGKAITGLQRDDFLLFENGAQQNISQFSSEYIPLSMLFLLDTSGSMEGEKLTNARKSIQQFIKQLRRGDEAMLMEFSGKPRVTRPFTGDFRKLKKDLNQLTADGSTALYDAIIAALDNMQSAHNRRRAILLISDGINTFGKARIEDTLEGLRTHGIELFTIGIEPELPGEGRDRITMQYVFNRLTQSSGGEAFLIPTPRELRRICSIISDRLHKQYSFGYYPPKLAGREWRSIAMETRLRGYRIVLSKNGYFPLHGAAESTQ